MPKKPSPNLLVRWADATAGDDVDRAIGNLFRSVPTAEPMSERDLDTTRRELQARCQPKSRRSAGPHATLLVAALVGAATSALAEWSHPGWWHVVARPFATAVVERPVVEPARPTPNAVPRDTSTTSAAVVPPATAPAAIEIQPESPKRVGGSSPVPAAHASETQADPPASDAPSPRHSALALESESLEPALVALRRDHDAAHALSLLDAHATRFPRGQLATEATLARVDSLLLLGRRSEALQSLERVPLAATSIRPDLLLLRAELRADADCRRALVDFDTVLAQGPSALQDERALYGRAGCRLREGDRLGAESDLLAYLSRYPAGRFADQVRARLAQHP